MVSGKDSTITFSINCPVAGAPASGIRKGNTPSQLKRDIARREAFLVLKAGALVVFGMAIHFDIWLMTVTLEKGEVSLRCNFGGVFCSGAAL